MMIYPDGPAVIQDVLAHLRKGEVVSIPTETVYGLVADAMNPYAVEKIFALKKRAHEKPLSVLIGSAEEMKQWAINISERAERLAQKFWPGPLTLILPKAPHLFSHIGTMSTVGLRVPNHPLALEVLHAFKGGLVAPSANPSGEKPATSAAEVAKYFSDDLWVIDGGPTHFGLASTVVDCTQAEPTILREGAISKKAIFEML